MKSSQFYGASQTSCLTNIRRKRRLEEAETRLRCNTIGNWSGAKLTDQYCDRQFVFSTQNAAIEKWRTLDQDGNLGLRVFSFEFSTNGKRNFMLCHPEKMWKILQGTKKLKRHFYEVIPQHFASKLYFDLEYSKCSNPDIDSDSIMQQFKTKLEDFVQMKLGRKLTEADTIDLDSSTETKFSRHLIIHSIVFKDNYHTGRFVKDFNQTLTETFCKEDEGETSLIDLSVYSKNRNFRMFKCCKVGKTATLELSHECALVHDSLNNKQVFLASLICPDLQGTKNPIEYGHTKSTVLLDDACSDGSPITRSSFNFSSPFPEIDQFILSQIQPGGQLRKVTFEPETLSVEYDILGYRFCENIGRWHKSNNIKIVALLRRSVYFQLCHDPDCKDFKSVDKPLPLDCQPWADLFTDVEAEVANDEDDVDQILVKAVEDFENHQSQRSSLLDIDEEDLIKACEDVENTN